jgi:hypothetical protein
MAEEQDRGVGRPSTIKSDLEAIRRCHRELVESRKRAAARAWKSARIWRSISLEKFVAVAAAGAAIACGGGLLLGIAAAGFASGFVAAKGREKRGNAIAASQLLKQSYGEVRSEIDAYFSRVRAANTLDLDLIPAHARTAAGYAFMRAVNGSNLPANLSSALDATIPKLSDRITDAAKLATNQRLRRAFVGLYDKKDPAAQANVIAFAQRGQNPAASFRESPQKPRLSSKGSGIGD